MMKNLIILPLICCLGLKAQVKPAESDSLGLPGDQLSLYGALELFKNATSIEDFEKQINSGKNEMNNLDLDGDGEVDYIMVNDLSDGDSHAFMLSVAIAEGDSRDLAAIAIEKNGNEDAVIQVIGDEDYYGADYYIEPSNELKSGGKGTTNGLDVHVNVWFWPSVRFVYSPVYVVWVSPWGWHRHPAYWHPWRPMAPNHWHHAHVQYNHLYVHSHTCHVHRAHGVYVTHRQAHSKSGNTPSMKAGRGSEKQSTGVNQKPATGNAKDDGNKSAKDRSTPGASGKGSKARKGKS